MNPVVRRAAPTDTAAITEMIHGLAAFERAPELCNITETQVNTALFGDSPTVHGHVAEADGQVAAMALWYLSFSTWDGVAGIYLEDLFVRPEFRRRGLARALLAALAGECVAKGYTRLSWAVLTGMPTRSRSTTRSAPSRSGSGRPTGCPATGCPHWHRPADRRGRPTAARQG